MRNESLAAVGKTIKELRTGKKMSLQQLAVGSGVTAGLLSKIENFRTIPSLPVLFDIANALEVSLPELVYDVRPEAQMPFLLVRKDEWSQEEREDSPGMIYQSILSKSSAELNIKINMVSVLAGTERKAVANDAHEILYVLSGEVTYMLPGRELTLAEGDTLFFDGRIPHGLQNKQENECRILVVYLM